MYDGTFSVLVASLASLALQLRTLSTLSRDQSAVQCELIQNRLGALEAYNTILLGVVIATWVTLLFGVLVCLAVNKWTSRVTTDVRIGINTNAAAHRDLQPQDPSITLQPAAALEQPTRRPSVVTPARRRALQDGGQDA